MTGWRKEDGGFIVIGLVIVLAGLATSVAMTCTDYGNSRWKCTTETFRQFVSP